MPLVFGPYFFIDQEPFFCQRPVTLKSANGSFLDPFFETLPRSPSKILFESFIDEPASVTFARHSFHEPHCGLW
jgi:hypothetical protein